MSLKELLQTVPQVPLWKTSSRPSYITLLPASLTKEQRKQHLINIIRINYDKKFTLKCVKVKN